ncbi:MAG: diguanylate cyclase [Deltaproteobacteria bacterium]|nr:diguanylate cyclase [Deltaproteobacteria bacterium]
MDYNELLNHLQVVGKDPSRLIFEDELTGLYNRRFLYNYFQQNIPWNALEDNPLSLLMMDVDYFKRINDSYGHDVGDQALIWVANMLREASGDKYLPIRYAGDEFMILMPLSRKKIAVRLAEKVISLSHSKPMRLDDSGKPLDLTLSIGVACAPEDAKGDKALIHKADTALYYAKKAGRDRLATVAEIVPQDVFVKTAMFQLERAAIAGRKPQLSAVAEALRKFSQRESQFLIAEGGPGMGKSMFLETVQRSLAQTKSILQIKAAGKPQELYRPYYLVAAILSELLKARKEKGAEILKGLSPEATNDLSFILPQLSEGKHEQKKEDKAQRERIFYTLLQVTTKIMDGAPSIWVVDDLHFSDEATLLFIRQMMTRHQVPLFVCGAATEVSTETRDGQGDTLGRFCAAHGKEIGIRKVALSPLAEGDVVRHLHAIFPRISLPKDFSKAMEHATQGNPLFLNEIVRKLVMDGKISLSGQQWVVSPLEEGYLPRSLEEIVRQKIAALDEESRGVLDQASVFGGQVSLSMLTGSSDKSEAKILEFLDKAISQGLISSDFQLNDETVQFLSRRVQDIAYGSIQKNTRQELHEKVGAYQESLYEKDLLPSAATLAYHFKRSANQEKARVYEQLQVTQNSMVFNAGEAVYYTGEGPAEFKPKELPLDAESVALLPNVFRTFLLAVRNTTLYPAGSKSITVTHEKAKEAIDKILERNDTLTVFQVERALLVNGKRVEIAEFKAFAASFLQLLYRLELKGVTLKRGLSMEELTTLLEAFVRTKTEAIEQGFWQRFIEEQKLSHVEMSQVHYAIRGEGEIPGPDSTGEFPAGAVAQEEAAEEEPARDTLSLIPEVIKGLLNAAKSIKLYPLKSKATESAIQIALKRLHRVLKREAHLTMARVEDSLFVNDQKVTSSDLDLVGQSFLQFLDSLGLKSMTFLPSLTPEEMRVFIGAVGDLPSGAQDKDYWSRLSKEQGLKGILFDYRFYETRIGATARDSGAFQIVAGARGMVRKQVQGQGVAPSLAVDEEFFDRLLQRMPKEIGDLLLEGEEKEITSMIKRIFHGYLKSNPQVRQKVIGRCQNLFEDLITGLQNQLAKILAKPLLLVLSQEQDPAVLRDLTNLLYRLSTLLVQFAEYPVATQILLHLQRRYRKFLEANSEQAKMFEDILMKPLDPKAQELILQDFHSKETLRQQNAVQLLGSLGKVASPLLIEVVKGDADLRIRQLAASLLSEQGYEAAKSLKRVFMLESTAEERLQILDVVDSVTRDLKAELVKALDDDNKQVRAKAFKLARRLNTDEVEKILFERADSMKGEVAADAIKCLGSLRPQAALDKIGSLMKTAKDKERLVACCHTLGQIGDPRGIDLLERVLAVQSFLSRRKKHLSPIRVAATVALAFIHDPRAAQVLEQCTRDQDPQVRQMAASLIHPTQPAENQ